MAEIDAKILAKIKKCLALASSSNPNEAATAMRQARAFEYTVVEDPTWSQVAPVLAEPGDCAD